MVKFTRFLVLFLDNVLNRLSLPKIGSRFENETRLHKPLKERTIYGIAAFAVVFGGIGLAIIVAASFDDYWKSMKWLQSLCNNLGRLIFTMLLISVFMERQAWAYLE
jgi:hypothetical protein